MSNLKTFKNQIVNMVKLEKGFLNRIKKESGEDAMVRVMLEDNRPYEKVNQLLSEKLQQFSQTRVDYLIRERSVNMSKQMGEDDDQLEPGIRMMKYEEKQLKLFHGQIKILVSARKYLVGKYAKKLMQIEGLNPEHNPSDIKLPNAKENLDEFSHSNWANIALSCIQHNHELSLNLKDPSKDLCKAAGRSARKSRRRSSKKFRPAKCSGKRKLACKRKSRCSWKKGKGCRKSRRKSRRKLVRKSRRKPSRCSGRKKRSCKSSKRCVYRRSRKSGRRRCVRKSRRRSSKNL